MLLESVDQDSGILPVASPQSLATSRTSLKMELRKESLLTSITVWGFTCCQWNTLRSLQTQRGWKITSTEWIIAKGLNFLFSFSPADVQLLMHQSYQMLEEAFMNDLLFHIAVSGGATKLGWRQEQLGCLSGVLGVMTVICWTGGSHGGLLLSHHLVPVTWHRDWYKSNLLCSGDLEKTNRYFKAQERKHRAASLTACQ